MTFPKTLLAALAGSLLSTATTATLLQSTQQSYPEASQRGNTRIFYWGQGGSAGQVAIDYGQPVWKDAYTAALGSQTTRWRLGQNFWTNLDTNMALDIGGERLEPGYYYLVLGRNEAGEFVLIALDPAEVREQRYDSFWAAKTTGGQEFVLEEVSPDKPAAKLQMQLKTDAADRDRATLDIHFGPHLLRTEIVMQPDPSVP